MQAILTTWFSAGQGENRIPEKFRTKENMDKLEYLLRFIHAGQSEFRDGIALKDVVNHCGMSGFQCNEFLNCLIKLKHIARVRGKSV